MIDSRTAPYAALLLRIALGVILIAHALLKILAFTPAGPVGFLDSLGIPGWFAYPVMGAELIGGALLVAGIQTRTVALALIPVLAGCIALLHGANGWLYTNQSGGWEYSTLLIIASVALALLGDGLPGKASLSRTRNKRSIVKMQPHDLDATSVTTTARC
jgi:putative oxidoreductase